MPSMLNSKVEVRYIKPQKLLSPVLEQAGCVGEALQPPTADLQGVAGNKAREVSRFGISKILIALLN